MYAAQENTGNLATVANQKPMAMGGLAMHAARGNMDIVATMANEPPT